MSDTCRLFPPFGDPWPSYLLPSHRDRGENNVFINTVVIMPKRLNGLSTQKLVERSGFMTHLATGYAEIYYSHNEAFWQEYGSFSLTLKISL